MHPLHFPRCSLSFHLANLDVYLCIYLPRRDCYRTAMPTNTPASLAAPLVPFYFSWVQQKPPPDPLDGVPEQPDVENQEGYHREHDRDFERNWHVVALQRDETQEEAEEILRLRAEVSYSAMHTLGTMLICI